MKTISIQKRVQTAVQPSPRVLQVGAMFGLGVDEQREIAVVPRCEIPLPHLNGRRGIVFVTGPSGSGKSTILKLIAQAMDVGGEMHRGACAVLRFDHLPPLPDVPLVDVFPDLPLDRALMLLSVAGLNEAFVMLRRPAELSDGQHYRLRLAHVMAMLCRRSARGAQDLRQNPTSAASHTDAVRERQERFADSPVESQVESPAESQVESNVASLVVSPADSAVVSLCDSPADSAVVIADEFGSTLDRITAVTIARNLRRWLNRHAPMPLSFVCATTHDDLLEALEPDVLVWKGLGEEVEVVVR